MDLPLLTAAARAAATADDRTSQAASAATTVDVRTSPATISCNEFIDETARCGADVLEPRHGMCLKHLMCVIIDTVGSDEKILSRCTCAPSQRLVCNLLIKSLNKAVCLPKSDV